MQRVLAFIRLSRLHFLLGGFLMFALGAFANRPIDIAAYVVGQLLVTSAQITAHYTNEYADFEADSQVLNRTNFSGGSGVLPAGLLPRIVALRAAQVTSVICMCAAIAMTQYSVTAAILGLCALAVSWAYSMPPVRLLSTGTGEVFTAITVAVLVPSIGAFSQHSQMPASLPWMMGALALIQLSMLLAFELPDLDSDARAGKRVLGVRLGRARTLTLILTANVLSVVCLLAGYAFGDLSRGSTIGGLLTAPLLAVAHFAARNTRHGLTTFASVAAFFLTGLCLLIAELQ